MTQLLYAKRPLFAGVSPLSLLFILLFLFSGYLQAEVVELRWNPNAEPDLVGYHVYRSQTPGSGYLRLNPDLVSTPWFTDETAKVGLVYYYVATAVNSIGIESPYSNQASGTGSLSASEPPLESGDENTVLVANLMNGNNEIFDSRVYLWNPTASAGEVTVRVFTLPVTGGTPQELTGTPLNLGTLEARSALNVRLAKDILAPLGTPMPYTNDGGNLTLEFTVGAGNIQGAARLYSRGQGLERGLAFGTYQLQEIPATPGSDPTVLVANFMNGNNAFINSRIYLWNPSLSAGILRVRVFTLPNTGNSLPLGEISLGVLGSSSARNIKLAEDILTPLGILLPYTNDGGNLTLEFIIEAPNVRGVAQVFSSNLAFGIYPLQQSLSTSGSDPTVLVANFMNGNNAFINSRIYLWNPSVGAGNVTARVFTLPLAGASTLLGTFDLGDLQGRSARNLKLAEDILTPLEIPLPYTKDGGNLTLEFTIDAPNVRGAAQVLSSDLAFGTYPLQEILPTSGPEPTVLIAPFVNGNNAAFNSRVYLWNSSPKFGEVSVRVFTLPVTGGTPQELTETPLQLGTLGAESGHNIRLAEDILAVLGIPLPYTDSGGNLILEFTIAAPDVRGTAQVFSSSLGFGTYPLQ